MSLYARDLVIPFGLLALSACDNESLSRAMDPPPPDAYVPPQPIDPADAGAGPDIVDPEAATEPVYLQTDRRLYSYDPRTNTTALVGTFHTDSGSIRDFVDIAIDLRGRLFAGMANGDIFRVDPINAACRFVSSADDAMTGMTFLSDGRLVTAGSRVLIVDIDTGLTSEELVPAGVYDTSGDIVGLPDGALYWTVQSASGAPDDLVRIDPSTRATQLLATGVADGLFGLGYAYGSLYGFSPLGIAVILDQTNGTIIEQRTLEGRWFGATTNPVLW